MMSARTPAARSTLFRAARAARAPRASPRFHPIRFQSTSSTSSVTNASSGTASYVAAGVAGGVVSAAVLYGVYSFTPAGKANRAINSTAKQVNEKYKIATKKLQENSPSADHAIEVIKNFAYSYIGWIPGGRAYVDAAFKDLDTIRENHGEDVDKIVSDTYKQLQEVAKLGLSTETLSKLYDVLADLSSKIADLGKDALGDILDNHPEAKEKLGANVDQLKKLGEQYGPEAKKQIDETWSQIKDIVAGGFSAENLDKARKILDEKVKQVKKLGDEAWEKGLEGVKPLLDKNPKIKEMVEKNADLLKQGNAGELFKRVKAAIDSGDTGDLEKYINDSVKKTKSAASSMLSGTGFESLSKYANMLPDGDKILPKIQQLREVAEKHKDEGERLFRETVQDIRNVLEKKSEEAEKIINKAKREAK